MSEVRLPILLPSVPGQRFDCQSCTRCCRELVVQVLDEDVRRIDEQRWARRLGVPPYVRMGRHRVLNQRPDGACVFLRDDDLCGIHAESGFDAKPLACQLYPFTLVRDTDRWLGAWRFDCPAVAAAKGRDMSSHSPLLRRLAPRLPHEAVRPPRPLDLVRGRHASPVEIDGLLASLDGWLAAEARSLDERLAGAALFTETLASANLAAVRDDRFVELVELLIPDLPNMLAHLSDAPPSPRQLGMFRQLVFAHTERLTLGEICSWTTRLLRRFRQFRTAGRFRRGVGLVPPLPGAEGIVDFAAVEQVAPASEEGAKIAGMLLRFLRTRLLSRYSFGQPYYGWPVFEGLQALWLSAAVTGWLSRCFAAAEDRASIAEPDVMRALACVDAAMGRVPALGTTAERLRQTYLARDSGIARLLRIYRVTDVP